MATAGILLLAISPAVHAAPTLTNVNNLSGGAEGSSTTISYSALKAAANENGSTNAFVLRSVTNGTLTEGGSPVPTNGTGQLESGESWVWTPSDPNAFGNGLAAFKIRASDGTDLSSTDVQVSVNVSAINDAPSFTMGGDQSVSESTTNNPVSVANWAGSISKGPNEGSQTLTFEVTVDSDPGGIFSVAPAISASGRLSYTQLAYANGTATISVSLKDNGGQSNGGVDRFTPASNTFTISVAARNNAPVIANAILSPINDNQIGRLLFQNVEIRDPDDGSPGSPATELVTVTVALDQDPPLGFFRFSGEEFPGGSIGGVTLSEAGEQGFKLEGRPGALTTALQTAVLFDPFPNELAVASPAGTISVDVTAEDGKEDGVVATTRNFSVGLNSINDVPTVSASLTPTTILDGGTFRPFRATISDVDPGDEAGDFELSINQASGASFGSIPDSLPLRGTKAELEAAVKLVRFVPVPNSVSVSEDVRFDITVTDRNSGTSATESATLTILGDTGAPEISGVSADVIRIDDDEMVLPFTTVAIDDPDGQFEELDVTIQLDDPAKGTLANHLNLDDLTPAEATAAVRAVVFTPATNRIPVGESETVVITINVVDSSGLTRSDGRTRVRVTSINGAPEITGLPGANDPPRRVSPAPPVDPFQGIAIGDEGGVTVTIEMDRPAKGTLFQIPGGATPATIQSYADEAGNVEVMSPAHGLAPGQFVEVAGSGSTPSYDGIHEVLAIEDDSFTLQSTFVGDLTPSGSWIQVEPIVGSFVFVGDAAAATAAVQALRFEVSDSFVFPPDSPGGTTFTISVIDSLGNRTESELSIILDDEPRNLLVTKPGDDLVPQDDPDPTERGRPQRGTLRRAVLDASSNDVITFALPGYPATIRLRAPIALDRNLSLRGPGADKLVISGDVDGDEVPDTQLFQVLAIADIEGVTLADGIADAGGAIQVASEGVLQLRSSCVSNCVATQYGGAIDVDGGALFVDRSLFEGNSTSEGGGLGGGAVSLFTDKACAFNNSTFSGNSQRASGGFGGGAIYAENRSLETELRVDIRHCTFTGNDDIAGRGTSIHASAFRTLVPVANTIVADGMGGNLRVAGDARIVSEGGNLSDDATRTSLSQGGNSDGIFFFDADGSDQTEIAEPILGPLTQSVGQTRIHPLVEGSPAIGAAVAPFAGTDQRGALRDVGSPDSGAVEYGAFSRLVINEIHFDPSGSGEDTTQFVEIYNPRDSVPTDLEGFQLVVDGSRRFVFATSRIVMPGHGVVIADSPIALAADNPTAVLSSPQVPITGWEETEDLPAIVHSPGHGLQSGAKVIISGAAKASYNGEHEITRISSDRFSIPEIAALPVLAGSPGTWVPLLDLGERGVVQIRDAQHHVVDSAEYVGKFVDPFDPANTTKFDEQSITLAPQFMGAAFLPHELVRAPISPIDGAHIGAGGQPDPTGDATSPGKDTGGTKFGADNADTIAIDDAFLVRENDLTSLDVRANDLDADGLDRVVIVDLSPPAAGGAEPSDPSGADTAIKTGAMADAVSSPVPHGLEIFYDPRVAFNHLPVGVEASDEFYYATLDIGTGPIAAVTNAAPNSRIYSPAHRLGAGEMILITGTSDGVYDGVREITPDGADHFTIPVAYAGDLAQGGAWEMVEPRGNPADRSQAKVSITIIGANDPPAPADDRFATTDGSPSNPITEDSVIRIMGDPDLTLNPVGFDTDSDFVTVPQIVTTTNLLGNDGDPDDDDDGSSLHIVGVLGEVGAITNYDAAPAAGSVRVSSASHGLADGDRVLISGYGGHPSYNGYHVVTVTDADTFILPVPYIDDVIPRGDWAILNDGGRLTATSAKGAAVMLEIRSDRIETNIVYDATVSDELHRLSMNRTADDFFHYAVEDRHGAVSFARIDITVTGVNDDPVPGADPGSLSIFDPLVDGLLDDVDGAGQDERRTALRELLSDLDVHYVLPSSDGDLTRAQVAVGAAADPSAGTFVIDQIRYTDEETFIRFNIDPDAAAAGDLLYNDMDVDSDDVLTVGFPNMVYQSREEAIVTVSSDGKTLTYDPAPSDSLNSLARDEAIIDTFEVTINDGYGPGVQSLVAVLVVGLNDTPVAVDDLGYSTHEDQLLIIGAPGVLGNDLERDQNRSLPDDTKMLLPVSDQPTTVSGARVYTTIGAATKLIDAFVPVVAPASTTGVTSPGHGLLDGEIVAVDGFDSSVYDGTHVVTVVDDETFTIPVAFLVEASPSGGFWTKVGPATGVVDAFGGDDGLSPITVTSAAHGLGDGEAVIVTGAGNPSIDGQYVITVVDENSFTIPAVFDIASSPAAGRWSTARSSLVYDPRASVSDTNLLPPLGLDGLAVGQSFFDQYEYTMFDGSFVFAMDDRFKVLADGAGYVLDVLANDRNLTQVSGTLELVAVGEPNQRGAASISTDPGTGRAVIVYSPEINYVGDEVFSYTVEDELGNRDQALVRVRATVNQLNGNLQANADHFTVALGESPELDVLANDNIIPANGASLRIEGIVTPPTNGTATFTDQGISYTPGSAQPDSLQYEISGGGSARATAWVSFEVVDRRMALHTRPDTFSVLADSVGNSLEVLANDNILPGTAEQLRIALTPGGAPLVSGPSHGTVELNASGEALIYTPDNGFLGVDSFTYTASDGVGGGGEAEVTIFVGSLKTNGDFFVVEADPTSSTDRVALDVLANDEVLQIAGGEVRIVSVVPKGAPTPNFGSISRDDASLWFDPNATQGEQTYIYTIEATSADPDEMVTAMGEVTVIVIEEGLSANPDYFSALRDSSNNQLDVLGNDSSVPDLGRQLAIVAIGTGQGAPDNGGLVTPVMTPDGPRLNYTPADGFTGEETFTYTMTDTFGTDTATVVVSVGNGNLNANDDAYTVFYREDGADTPEADDDLVVGFTLPVILNDSVLPDTGQVLSITGVGINDGNPGGENAPSEMGSVEISPDGTAVIYTPAKLDSPPLDLRFFETFTYELSDGTARRAEAQVTVEVRNRIDVRTIETNDDAYTVQSDSLGNVLPVLANDGVKPASAAGWEITEVTMLRMHPADPDPDDAIDAGVTAIAPGFILYSPRAGFVGTVKFGYEVSDGLGGTGSGEVTVKVGDIRLCDDLFVALSDSGEVALDVLANDGVLPLPAPDGEDRFLLQSVDDPDSGGSARIEAGRIHYTPLAGFVGDESFAYRVRDDSGNEIDAWATVQVHEAGSDRSSAFVTIEVKGVNDLPVIEGAGSVTTTDKQVHNPFAKVTLSDVDDQGNELLTLTVSLDQADQGILFHPGGLFTWVGDNYVSSPMTPAEATLALRGLLFQSTPGGRISPGNPETTTISLSVFDGHETAVNGETAVTAEHPPSSQVLPLDEAGGHISQSRAEFGSAVAISGNTLAVGSRLRNAAGSNTGAVFIYHRMTAGSLDEWLQVTVVTPESPAIDERFGEVLALDGDTLLVGAPGAQSSAGAAYVFERNSGGIGNWGQVARLVGAGTRRADDKFGAAVAIDGDTALVGAPFSDRVAGNSGSVAVFERDQDGPGVWGLRQEIVQQAAVFRDFFGGSVDIDGDTLIVGASGVNRSQDTAGLDLGAAYIFERNGSADEPWQETRKLDRFEDSRSRMDDRFGSAVGISGDTVVIGASGFNPTVGGGTPEEAATIDAGAAFIFQRDESGPDNWGLLRDVLGPDPGRGEFLGHSVAISESVILVGARSTLPATIGSFVLCLQRDIDQPNNWRNTDTLFPPDPSIDTGFGSSVALSAESGAVGAVRDSANPINVSEAGAVYVAQFEHRWMTGLSSVLQPWQLENFSLSTISDPGSEESIWGLYANPDGDDHANIFEFLFASDPGASDDPVSIERLEDVIHVTYPRSKTFSSEKVEVQWGTDLESWTADGVEEVVVEDLGTVELIRASVPRSGGRRVFVRLNAIE